MLKPCHTENAEVNGISWTKLEKLNIKDTNNRQELCHHSHTSNELLAISTQSSSQPKPDNQSKQSGLLEDAQVPQEA